MKSINPIKDSRRSFIKQSSLLTGALLVGNSLSAMPFALRVDKPSLIMDAMGEIRTIYTLDLIKKILASGTNSVTITLTDPKIYGEEGFHTLLEDLANYDRYFDDNPSLFVKCKSMSDFERAKKEGKLAIFYLIQNSAPIEKELDRLDFFYNLGLRSVQLTYNYRNYVGDGCYERTDAGLSTYGLEMIAKMNEMGMLIDLSHAGMLTMKETIEHSEKPVIISHTCCKTLFDHDRNTTDENLKLLADNGGVVGLTQIRIFMTHEKTNNTEVYFDHIDHAVKVAGIDAVCIGSDRDHRVIPDTEEEILILLKEEGAQFKPDHWPLYLEKLNGPSRMNVVYDGLVKRGYTQDQIDKIMGKNLHRIYTDVIG
ncbi:MAG: membrane dipeptidase [Cyclobacteriaceae bacterium]